MEVFKRRVYLHAAHIRIRDLGENDTLSVSCKSCRRVAEFSFNWRQRHWHRTQDKRLLEMHFRCNNCGEAQRIEIKIWDKRGRYDNRIKRSITVIPASEYAIWERW